MKREKNPWLRSSPLRSTGFGGLQLVLRTQNVRTPPDAIFSFVTRLTRAPR